MGKSQRFEIPCEFLGKKQSGVLPLCDDRRTPVSSSSFVHSQSDAVVLYIPRTVGARMTKFHRDICTELPNIYAGYDVTNYYRSEVVTKKPSKIPHQTASGGISRGLFYRGSPHFTRLSGTTGPYICQIRRH